MVVWEVLLCSENGDTGGAQRRHNADILVNLELIL